MKVKDLEKLIAICAGEGWDSTTWSTSELEVYWNSPAGEDFGVSIELANPVLSTYENYENFDVEEHVYMWLNAKVHGVTSVPYVTVLVEDAQAIEKKLDELATAVAQKFYIAEDVV